MNKELIRRTARALGAALFCAATAAPVGAQTTPPARSEGVSPANTDEEIIELSPFEVNTEKDKGYAATSTLAGTRINTELKDVGSAIQVVTPQFLQDTGATNNQKLLLYTTNTEVGGLSGNYAGVGNGAALSETNNLLNPQNNTRVRGLTKADNTRDFFLTSVPWDSFDAGRIDLQRGPNAMLFGQGSPGGIINANTNPALFKNEGNVEFRFGRFGSTRGSLDVNRELLPKELALRVATLYSETEYQQKPAYNDDKRIYSALRYDPHFLNNGFVHTSVTFNIESGNIHSNNPRQLPVQDNITPWFSGMNKATYDPFASWVVGAQVWTPHGVVNAPTGQALPNTTSGDPNPAYQPWIGEFGSPNAFQQGVVFIKGGTGTQGQTFLQPTLTTSSTASAIGKTINGISYNQLNGVASYANYAINAKLPNYSLGLYRNTYLTDRSIFDYENNLIDGNTKSEWQGWTTFTASLSQDFLQGRAGFEVVAHRESYRNGQASLFADPGINVDINSYFVDGTANPNVGRPYVSGSGQYGNNSLSDIRESYRATIYGTLKASDFLDEKSYLARFLGHHRFTVFGADDRENKDARTWMQYAADNLYAQDTTSPTQLRGNGARTIQVVDYIGPSLLGASSASGAHLSQASDIWIPSSGTINVWRPVWTAPASVDPNGAWTPPAGQAGTVNADNPANYQGWTTVPVNVWSAKDGDIYKLYTGATKNKQVVRSLAATWQGFMVDDSIVPILGVRRDLDRIWQVTAPTQTDGIYDVRSPKYSLGGLSPLTASGNTVSFSLVTHLSKLLHVKLPASTEISLFFNRSSDFQPSAGRVDVFNQQLGSPSGKTKEYGIMISTLDGRVVLRVNKYRTEVKEQSISIDNMWALGHDLNMGYNFYEIYSNNYGPDWERHYLPLSGQTQADADAQQVKDLAAWKTFLADPTTQKMFSAWKIDTNPATGWQVNGGNDTTKIPVGISATGDTLSEGYEFEITAQPTSNWSITADASKTTATEQNVGGGSLVAWVKHYNDFMRGDGGNLRLWWGGNNYTERMDWNSNFYSGWTLATLGAGSDVAELRPWHFSIVTNYNFTYSALKGFNVGGGYRWQDREIIGYRVTTGENDTPQFDLANPYKGPSESAVDLWIGYEHKLPHNLAWRIQLNLNNVFADSKLIPITTQPDGTPAGVRLPNPMTWEITNRISF